MPEAVDLKIEIKNQEPVELSDLTQSFFGFADEYQRWMTENDPSAQELEVKLYVKEMHSGSIIATLQAMAPMMLPLIEHTNTIFDFCTHLRDSYEYLLGRSKEKPKGLTKSNYQNLSRIVEPIVKDNGAQLIIGTINATAPVQVTINYMEANAAQNRAKNEMAKLQEPSTGIHEKVLLYWYQARNDPKSKSGDKGIIESIYKGPVKVVFSNDGVKAKTLLDTENPFTHAYVADVAVETIQSKPALYRVINIHETIDISASGTESSP